MGKFAPEADFEMKYFQSELAQRPVNRFQRPWTLFLAKIMPQIDSTHSKTPNMHPGAVPDPVVFFLHGFPSHTKEKEAGSDFDRGDHGRNISLLRGGGETVHYLRHENYQFKWHCCAAGVT